jgi:hypothetical protein
MRGWRRKVVGRERERERMGELLLTEIESVGREAVGMEMEQEEFAWA